MREQGVVVDAVSRGELLEQVWQLQGDPGSNVVDVYVRRLRDGVTLNDGPTLPAQAQTVASIRLDPVPVCAELDARKCAHLAITTRRQPEREAP